MNGIRFSSSSARRSMYRRCGAIRDCSSTRVPRRSATETGVRVPRPGSGGVGAGDCPGEVIIVVAHPLVDVGPVLPTVREVGVELVGDDHALLEVEVADGVALRAVHVVGIDGTDVGVVHAQQPEQLVEIVPLSLNGQVDEAPPDLTEPLFHAFAFLQWGETAHGPRAGTQTYANASLRPSPRGHS